MGVMMGVAPRQRREPSGMCILESDSRRGEDRKWEEHFVVRFLESLPAGTSFPAMAKRFGEAAAAVTQRTGSRPEIFIDATGFGQPFIDEVKKQGDYSRISPVYFTHGDQRLEDGGIIRLGKCWLVTRLQMLLQTHQLHLPRSTEAEMLAEELMNFEVQVAPDANDRYGAFKVGTRDQLVTALGLSVQRPPLGRIEYGKIRLR